MTDGDGEIEYWDGWNIGLTPSYYLTIPSFQGVIEWVAEIKNSLLI
jgi:hypothetical protein